MAPQPSHPNSPGGLNMLNMQLPRAQLPYHRHQQQPLQHQQQQQHVHHQQQQQQQQQQTYPQQQVHQQQQQQQQQQQLQTEIVRLRKALGERDEEVARLNTQASKLSRVRDQVLEQA